MFGVPFGISVVVIVILSLTSSKSVFLKEKFFGETTTNVKECNFRSFLTGKCVEEQVRQVPTVVAVMIENHPESRPQAGLAEADVVYEAMVEGNYTRFLALYPHTASVTKVGPVRSARPYFLDWIAEYGSPLYMHVGGSPEALALIAKRNVWDANEFYFGNSFWRASNRYAPHNTYTNTERWQKLVGEKTGGNLVSWSFATSTEICANQCVDFVEIPYLRPSFVTGWKYSSSTGRYTRWQDGIPHQTETGLIEVDTVVIMEAPVKVLDSVGRLEMKTLGSGPSVVIVRGQKISGTWHKKTLADRTTFLDETGAAIGLVPGKIWIQVVPRLSLVNFTHL